MFLVFNVCREVGNYESESEEVNVGCKIQIIKHLAVNSGKGWSLTCKEHSAQAFDKEVTKLSLEDVDAEEETIKPTPTRNTVVSGAEIFVTIGMVQ